MGGQNGCPVVNFLPHSYHGHPQEILYHTIPYQFTILMRCCTSHWNRTIEINHRDEVAPPEAPLIYTKTVGNVLDATMIVLPIVISRIKIKEPHPCHDEALSSD